MVEDCRTCVGLITRLTGGPLDGMKVAGVPLVADFGLSSLSHPKVKLAIISAPNDRWLIPKFHSEAVLKACASCETLAHLSKAGHGALLSPPPPDMDELVADLVGDRQTSTADRLPVK